LVLTGTFRALITYTGFALVLFAALATAGLFRLRSRPEWKKTSAVNWCYPLVPLLFLVSSSWMLIFSIYRDRRPAALGLLTIATGGILYHLIYKQKSSRRTDDQ